MSYVEMKINKLQKGTVEVCEVLSEYLALIAKQITRVEGRLRGHASERDIGPHGPHREIIPSGPPSGLPMPRKPQPPSFEEEAAALSRRLSEAIEHLREGL